MSRSIGEGAPTVAMLLSSDMSDVGFKSAMKFPLETVFCKPARTVSHRVERSVGTFVDESGITMKVRQCIYVDNFLSSGSFSAGFTKQHLSAILSFNGKAHYRQKSKTCQKTRLFIPHGDSSRTESDKTPASCQAVADHYLTHATAGLSLTGHGYTEPFPRVQSSKSLLYRESIFKRPPPLPIRVYRLKKSVSSCCGEKRRQATAQSTHRRAFAEICVRV
jgi:hypothetical protein